MISFTSGYEMDGTLQIKMFFYLIKRVKYIVMFTFRDTSCYDTNITYK